MIASQNLAHIENTVAEVWREAELQPGARLVTPLYELLGAFWQLGRVLEISNLTYHSAAREIQKETGKAVRLPKESDDKLAGFIYAEPMGAHILVSYDDPIARRRFSIAHELGHFVLHILPRFDDDDAPLHFSEGIAPDSEEKLPTGQLLSNNKRLDAIEIQGMEDEANAFAAALLMPENICRNLYERIGPQVGFRRMALARRLSADLLVSRQALKYRLDALELGQGRWRTHMKPQEFVKKHGGCRVSSYNPQPPLWNAPGDDGDNPEVPAQLDYEVEPNDWKAISPCVPSGFHPAQWEGAPLRFVDGKDVGDTVLWLQPQGYPAPVRLSQIGATVVEVQDRECRRIYYATDKTVTFVADAFPWEEIEGLSQFLNEKGFRLLPAQAPGGVLSWDYEKMRKAAQNRSNDEMGVYEECALAQALEVPTVVDGRLEPRSGAFNSKNAPVIGVIKTHKENYLHPKGLQLLYRLDCAQRTPAFLIDKTRGHDGEFNDSKLPVVSWYVKLCGGKGSLPNTGYVRVEVTQAWLEKTYPDSKDRIRFFDYLSRTLFDYRCRDDSYGRAAISLEPIVRAEEKLGALFQPSDLLASRFCRLMGV